MGPQEIGQILSQNPLFSRLEIKELEHIFSRYFFPVSSYPKGRIISVRGEKYEELEIIIEGTLRAEVTDLNNKTMIVEQLSAPQTIASAIFFADDKRLPVDLVAHTAARLVRITRSQLKSIFREFPRCLEGFLADTGSRVQFLAKRLRMSSMNSLSQKVAVYLLENIAGENTPLEIPASRQEMADIFGVARPSVSRICSDLETQGLIRVRGRKITILDREKLVALAKSNVTPP